MRSPRLCSKPRCGRVHVAHGFCLPHYLQARRRGVDFENARGLVASSTLIKNLRLDVYEETEGRCMTKPGPCADRTCRLHLWEGREDQDLSEPCSLRLADQGPLTLEQVAKKMGLTRERIRQIEAKALLKLRTTATHAGLAEAPTRSTAAA